MIILPAFIPHIGCPHTCVFCDQQSITGLSHTRTLQETQTALYQAAKTLPLQKEAQIAFYGGSFTALDPSVQRQYLDIATHLMQSCTQIRSIRLSTRPDAISSQDMEWLQKYPVQVIEIGAQSMDDAVLKRSLRGHLAQDVRKACAEIRRYPQIQLGLQMMIGLPGQDRQSVERTVKELAALKPDFVRIYPVIVMKNTALAAMCQQGIYRSLSLEEAVSLSAWALAAFSAQEIPVIRIGLQATELVAPGQQIAQGPFHPAFGELVRSRLLRDWLEKRLENADAPAVFTINERYMSLFIGQARKSLTYLQTKSGRQRLFEPLSLPRETLAVIDKESFTWRKIALEMLGN